MTDKNIQMSQRNSDNTGWDNLFPKTHISNVDDLAEQLATKATITKANINYYVSTTGSDSNNGLTSGTSFRTVQHAFDVLPDVINNIVTIYLSDGTYNENAVCLFKGGSGQIRVKSLNGVPENCIVQGQLMFYGCACFTAPYNIKILRGSGSGYSADPQNGCLVFVTCHKFRSDGCLVDGNSKSDQGIYVFQSDGIVASCRYYHTTKALYANGNSHVLSEITGISSTDHDYGLYATRGSVIRKNGTQITATTAEYTTQGGIIA